MEIHRIRSMAREEKNEVNLLLLEGTTHLNYWGAIQSDQNLVTQLRVLMKQRRHPLDRLGSMTEEERTQVRQLLLEGATKAKTWADLQPDAVLVQHLRELLRKRFKKFEDANVAVAPRVSGKGGDVASVRSDVASARGENDAKSEKSPFHRSVPGSAGGSKAGTPEVTSHSPLHAALPPLNAPPAVNPNDVSISFAQQSPSVRTVAGEGSRSVFQPTNSPERSVPKDAKGTIASMIILDDDAGEGASRGSRDVCVMSDAASASDVAGSDPDDGQAAQPSGMTKEAEGASDHASLCARCRRCEDAAAELALWEACGAGAINCVRYLVEERGVEFDKSDKDGWTPVHTAARAGHLNIVRYLVEKGADFEDTGSVDEDAASRDEDVVMPSEREEEEGGGAAAAVIPGQGTVGWTALHAASQEGHLDVVRFLVEEKGAKYNEPDQYGWTPVHVASEGGHSDVVQFLVEKGASVERANKHGRTPVHVAAREGHLDLVKFLIEENGADFEKGDRDGWTPVHAAFRGGHLDVVQYLVEEKGADWTKPGKDGRTPVHAAARGGGVDVLKWFLTLTRSRMMCFQRDNKGLIPVHHAAIKSQVATVRWFVQQFGEEILWFPDRDGNTTLHLAARWWFDADVVKYVVNELRLTTLCHVPNNHGDLPFDIAAKKCKELLRRAGDRSVGDNPDPMRGWSFLSCCNRLQPETLHFSPDETAEGNAIATELRTVSRLLAETIEIGPEATIEGIEATRGKIMQALERIQWLETIHEAERFLRENYGRGPLLCSPEILLNFDVFALTQTTNSRLEIPSAEAIWKLNYLLSNAAGNVEIRMYLFNPENDPKERKLILFEEAGKDVKKLLHGWGVGKTPPPEAPMEPEFKSSRRLPLMARALKGLKSFRRWLVEQKTIHAITATKVAVGDLDRSSIANSDDSLEVGEASSTQSYTARVRAWLHNLRIMRPIKSWQKWFETPAFYHMGGPTFDMYYTKDDMQTDTAPIDFHEDFFETDQGKGISVLYVLIQMPRESTFFWHIRTTPSDGSYPVQVADARSSSIVTWHALEMGFYGLNTMSTPGLVLTGYILFITYKGNALVGSGSGISELGATYDLVAMLAGTTSLRRIMFLLGYVDSSYEFWDGLALAILSLQLLNFFLVGIRFYLSQSIRMHMLCGLLLFFGMFVLLIWIRYNRFILHEFAQWVY